MRIRDRLFCFFKNLMGLFLILLAGPFYLFWSLSGTIYIVFFVTDGSTALVLPWHWNWGEITIPRKSG